ncbi:MAG: hypothetical protein ACJ780_01425 [Solirubrobacteraceae bacterium]
MGAQHIRRRKLLLPPFHGEPVQRHVTMIADVARQEIGDQYRRRRWTGACCWTDPR